LVRQSMICPLTPHPYRTRRPPVSDLKTSIRATTDAMSWLTPADQAAVDLAYSYAATIDQALESGDAVAVTKALYLGPHLLNTLAALGGTPAGRKALELKEDARGKLAGVRDIRERPAPSKKRVAVS
jgi:hypothetical protein